MNKFIGPIGLAAVAIAVLVAIIAFAGKGNVGSYVDATYARDEAKVPAANENYYVADSGVLETADDIAAAHKPAERADTEAGVFLRYGGHYVTVTPQEAGDGTSILVDRDRERGYRRTYMYVGGRPGWGPYVAGTGTRGGSGFRGGGPGAGK